MFDKAYWQAAEKYIPEPEAKPRPCEAPGCTAIGEHRAPKSPTDLRNYRWFCLPHVQEYNKSWDYYKGKNIAEMERERREDIVGHRPTWPLGHLHATDADLIRRNVWNRFFGRGRRREAQAAEPAAAHGLTAEEQSALQRLGLSWPVSMYEVKQRYRGLVKKHHPDRQQSEKDKGAANELIKLINRAYAVIVKKLRA